MQSYTASRCCFVFRKSCCHALIVIILSSLFLSQVGVARADPLLKLNRIEECNRRFIESVQSKLFCRITRHLTCEDDMRQGKERVMYIEEFRHMWSRNSDSMLIEYSYPLQMVPAERVNYVTAINSKYAFRLDKKKHTNSLWAISNIALSTDPDLDTSKVGFADSYRRPSRAKRLITASIQGLYNHYVGAEKIIDMHKRDSQSIIFLSSSDIDTFRFQRKLPMSHNSSQLRIDTILTFGPNPYRLPTKIFESAKHDGMEFELQSDVVHNFVDGQLDSADSTRIYKIFKNRVCDVNVVTKEKTKYDYSPIPDSEFTLSAYGFPEPPGVDWSWRMPAYGWALIVAFLCGSLILFWRLRRKSP